MSSGDDVPVRLYRILSVGDRLFARLMLRSASCAAAVIDALFNILLDFSGEDGAGPAVGSGDERPSTSHLDEDRNVERDGVLGGVVVCAASAVASSTSGSNSASGSGVTARMIIMPPSRYRSRGDSDSDGSVLLREKVGWELTTAKLWGFGTAPADRG